MKGPDGREIEVEDEDQKADFDVWSQRREKKMCDVVAVTRVFRVVNGKREEARDQKGRAINARVSYTNPLKLQPHADEVDEDDEYFRNDNRDSIDTAYTAATAETVDNGNRLSIDTATGEQRVFVLPEKNKSIESRSPIPYSVRGELLKFRVRTAACVEVWLALVRGL